MKSASPRSRGIEPRRQPPRSGSLDLGLETVWKRFHVKQSTQTASAVRRLPPWFRGSTKGGRTRHEVRRLLRDLQLNTVCESARCPNLCECWRRRTATVMILGNQCTRNCRFCAVDHGCPELPDCSEPARVAEAAQRLQLRYIVITSVTRDDLPDGGAGHFADVIRTLRSACPEIGVEVLTPDFGGDPDLIHTVVMEQPTVFSHNIETCRGLTAHIRSGADYDRSLSVLRSAAEQANDATRIKSGFMLGMGEGSDDIHQMLQDLHEHGATLLTIGQYLAPSDQHWPVKRFVHPDEFASWETLARERYGFSFVASGPLVRSSYLADQAAGMPLHNA